MKDAVLHPKHPERICWGCERYCPANDLCCREDRVAHPDEPFEAHWESPKPRPILHGLESGDLNRALFPVLD